MKTVTPTELQANIYKLMKETLETGVPVESGQKLRNLIPRPNVIQGNSEDLVTISWEKEVNLDSSVG